MPDSRPPGLSRNSSKRDPDDRCCHEESPALGRPSRRRALALGAAGAAAGVLGVPTAALAATGKPAATGAASMTVTLLGTAGGPPPVTNRAGIASAVTVAGRTYLVDCGRGVLTQYLKAGLPLSGLAGIFLTHLHSDHVADYWDIPMLGLSTMQPLPSAPVPVWGPGPSGLQSVDPSVPGPAGGTAAMTASASRAYSASTSAFIAEQLGTDPAALVSVTEVMPPAASGASPANPAPAMQPWLVLDDGTVRVTAICVPHGAIWPSFAYRFDTEFGSVTFSGDTAPTPNIPVLAHGTDLLVHEAASVTALAAQGAPPALIAHTEQDHTDVSLLGGIAAASGAKALWASHLGPASSAAFSDQAWRAALRAGGKSAGYRGALVLGEDLMSAQIGNRVQRRLT